MERRAERRLVTCVFIDIVESTDLTRRLGPERVQRLFADAFAEMSTLALAEGGTVEKYIGDEVFVLFGAPVAHADDVRRALRLADACVRRVAGPLAVRGGVETGEALVDLAAIEERQRMAVGDCVNIAARLQHHAEPGQLLVGPVCHAAAASFAEFADVGTLDLKGFGPVPAWRVLGISERDTAPLPFVGREAEFAKLRETFEHTRQGRARLALVSGEPGIGKSRLAQEFINSLPHDVQVLETRCRPGTEVGTSPLSQLLANVDPSGLPAAIAHSVGLSSDPRLLALSALDRRNEIFAAWRDYLAELARQSALVMWIEDVHWADGELIRLVDRLTFASELPLLVVITARPGFPAMTALRPNPDRLTLELGPLDDVSATTLARAAGAHDARRVTRAAGHPLFIVELVRARGALGGELPVTVQAAIGARLDELAQDERELLQRVAVVGETFNVRDAALLLDREPADVAGMLGRLAHLRYIHAVDGAFRFHHALVRDIAYGRLPVATRMRLHARYAQEGLQQGNVDALAHHWWAALAPPDADWVWEGEPQLESMRADALRAHLAAGSALADRLAEERAREVLTRALELTRNSEERAGVEEAFGTSLARNAKGDEATQHRFRAIELWKASGKRVPPTLYADALDLAVFNWGYFKHLPSADGLVALMNEGIALAREARDGVALVRLLTQRAYFTNDRRGLAEVEQLLDGVVDKRPYADALWRVAVAQLVVAGDCAKAIAGLDLALDLGVGGADLNEPEALVWQACAYVHAGDLTAAEAAADRLVRLSVNKSAHTRQHALAAKGLVRFARADWPGVAALADDLRAIVDGNPDASFCILGANLAGYGAMAEVIRRRPIPADLSRLIERLLPEAPAIRAAALLVPNVMAGLEADDAEAQRAYASMTRLADRQAIWDLAGVNLALAAVMRTRWKEAETELQRMEQLAEGGAAFAAALASAVREEIAAARGGPKPTHDNLRRLGYLGVSELLSYRPRPAANAIGQQGFASVEGGHRLPSRDAKS